MTHLQTLIQKAAASPRHIVLAEGHDLRVIQAAVMAINTKIAKITLLGPTAHIRKHSRASGDALDEITIIDPQTIDTNAVYIKDYFYLRKHSGMTFDSAQEALKQPLIFANMMVRHGDADGSIAGAINSTEAVVRAALHIIGVNKTSSFISSLFLMIMNGGVGPLESSFIFSDCGLVVDPDPHQLAEIAIAASDKAPILLGVPAKIAMLSFATGESARHIDVDKIKQATDLLKQHRPALAIDGPVQFDAAISSEIAQRKAPDSHFTGQANVFIFPDLNSGNIGYKIAEHLGGAKAIGPILQGLNKPANDLSRGCDAEAIFNMIAVTVLQAQSRSQHPSL